MPSLQECKRKRGGLLHGEEVKCLERQISHKLKAVSDQTFISGMSRPLTELGAPWILTLQWASSSSTLLT